MLILLLEFQPWKERHIDDPQVVIASENPTAIVLSNGALSCDYFDEMQSHLQNQLVGQGFVALYVSFQIEFIDRITYLSKWRQKLISRSSRTIFLWKRLAFLEHVSCLTRLSKL